MLSACTCSSFSGSVVFLGITHVLFTTLIALKYKTGNFCRFSIPLYYGAVKNIGVYSIDIHVHRNVTLLI